MRRRDLLRRTATASVLAAGGAGLASASTDGPTHVKWEFPDGSEEAIPIGEFDRRSDTPDVEDLSWDDESTDEECCYCVDGGVPCTPCIVLPRC
ncbi:hypothetical protein [Halorussus halobius]|uniref:hypothetical protein n=1 Tax=Halorussus halobius TaxID=1710537 RepID=UPI001092A83B|nr:hypothetical protein [Halorussus halobius]